MNYSNCLSPHYNVVPMEDMHALWPMNEWMNERMNECEWERSDCLFVCNGFYFIVIIVIVIIIINQNMDASDLAIYHCLLEWTFIDLRLEEEDSVQSDTQNRI